MAEGQVTLAVEWWSDEIGLEARYRVTNGLTQPVVVFDRLFSTDPAGKREVQPLLAFVRVTPDKVLLMEKLVPALPQDREVEAPVVPYARLVEPGAVLEGVARVQVPILTTPAYGRPGTQALAARAKQAVFRLGWAPALADAAARPMDTPDGPVWALRHNWAAQHQRVIEAPPQEVDLEVPVNDPLTLSAPTP